MSWKSGAMSRTRCVVCFAVKGHGAADTDDATLTASKMEAKNLRENMLVDRWTGAVRL